MWNIFTWNKLLTYNYALYLESVCNKTELPDEELLLYEI